MTQLSLDDVPSSCLLPAKSHSLSEEVGREVNNYFIENWPFSGEKDRLKFLGAGFSRVTCMYFPLALDDRIHFACRLLTLLFLIDGESLTSTGSMNELIRHSERDRSTRAHVLGGGYGI
jgi:hypothetical protein